MTAQPPDGVMSVDEAVAAVRAAQAAGLTVVMCHGCFDLVHPGHVRHLRQAARLGDRLLVTVTGDAMMDKGIGRPLIPQELRAENLAAIDGVDWVAISALPTAVELLEQVRPDVYVKGREYESNRDPRFEREKAVVKRHGGRVVFTSGDVVFSSTALIESLRREASSSPGWRRLVEHHAALAPRLDAALHRARGKRILVVGDTVVDTYVMCDRPHVASEGPMMTLRPMEYCRYDGGAAIVARHLAAMGAKPVLLTALPRTVESETMRLRLEVEGVDVDAIELDGALVEKQRFLVGTDKVMKLDIGEPAVLDTDRRGAVVDRAGALARECSAMVVADYGQGLLGAETLRRTCRAARPFVDVLTGDVSGRRASLLALLEADLLCPTEFELRSTLNDWEAGLGALVWRLLGETSARAAFITLGAEGMIAFGHGLHDDARGVFGDPPPGPLPAEHVPALARHPVDSLGCGDALLAAATISLVGGAGLVPAAVLGSIAAEATSRQLGNPAVGATDLRRGLRRLDDSARSVATGAAR